ncbi:MAG TPA: hypothetical protein PKJ91_04290 [Methanoregulaceae archaeon]|nr:hypothetical protein [Methanoregulaceae archaeon]
MQEKRSGRRYERDEVETSTVDRLGFCEPINQRCGGRHRTL